MQPAVVTQVMAHDADALAVAPGTIARVRAGDAQALEVLFRAFYGPLCGFAYRYTAERALAEELVQDVFAELWTRRAELEVQGSARSYLFAAVRNRALNLRKRQAMERDWERDEAQVRALHPAAPRIDQALEARELRDRLDAAIESLPERCRLVMHLRWREQMSYAAIADVMGISAKGVEIQLSRGLRVLRERFLG
jgi:RNA polymerase sigma-70 factor, ECF subfamily